MSCAVLSDFSLPLLLSLHSYALPPRLACRLGCQTASHMERRVLPVPSRTWSFSRTQPKTFGLLLRYEISTLPLRPPNTTSRATSRPPPLVASRISSAHGSTGKRRKTSNAPLPGTSTRDQTLQAACDSKPGGYPSSILASIRRPNFTLKRPWNAVPLKPPTSRFGTKSPCQTTDRPGT